jgi:hypothetical protein
LPREPWNWVAFDPQPTLTNLSAHQPRFKRLELKLTLAEVFLPEGLFMDDIEEAVHADNFVLA